MNLKSLRSLLAIGLLVFAGHGWAKVSLPENENPKWNDISGIVWSTDNGSTWGNSSLTVGQSVEFKLTLHKSYDGKHYADFIKTWIDWNGDEDFSADETLLFGFHVVNSSYTPNDPLVQDKFVDQSFNFISSPVTITSAMLGDRFLLARVTCSESLLAGQGGTWSDQWSWADPLNGNPGYNNLFSATAAYYQGESQLVNLHVNGNNVPEPGTFALLAVAMAGLGVGRKRASRVRS